MNVFLNLFIYTPFSCLALFIPSVNDSYLFYVLLEWNENLEGWNWCTSDPAAEYQLNASITMNRGKGEERDEGRNGAEKGERREGVRWEVKHKEGGRGWLPRGTRQHGELRAPVRVHRSLYWGTAIHPTIVENSIQRYLVVLSLNVPQSLLRRAGPASNQWNQSSDVRCRNWHFFKKSPNGF